MFTPILALPEPSWHTADLIPDEVRRAFNAQLFKLSDDELSRIHGAQLDWFGFHFGWGASIPAKRSSVPSLIYRAEERNRRFDRAERVEKAIEREIISRWERSLGARKSAAARAAQTRALNRVRRAA